MNVMAIFTHCSSSFAHSGGYISKSDEASHPVGNEAISFLMKIVIDELSTSLSIHTNYSTRVCIVVDKLCKIHVSEVNLIMRMVGQKRLDSNGNTVSTNTTLAD